MNMQDEIDKLTDDELIANCRRASVGYIELANKSKNVDDRDFYLMQSEYWESYANRVETFKYD